MKTFFNKLAAFLRLLAQGFSEYKKQVALLIALGFGGGLLEGVGINAFIPLFSFIAGGGKGDDVISKTIERGFAYLHVPFSLRYLLVFICALFLLRAVFLFAGNYLKTKVAADYEERTRSALLSDTLAADWPHLLRQKLGHLHTLIMTNVGYGELLLNHVASAVVLVTGLVMYLLVAFNISVTVTFSTLLFGTLLFAAFKPIISRTRRIAYDMERLNKALAHHLSESMLGMKTLKTMRAEEAALESGRDFFRKLRDYRLRVSLYKLMPETLMQPLGLFFIVGLFAFTYKSPGFNIAALAAVMYLIQRMFVYAEQLQSHFTVLSESVPYVSALVAARRELAVRRETLSGNKPFSFARELCFEDVSFSYGAGREVLNGVSFTLRRGETVGLIGASGSGKTTVADLILRLFSPEKGHILLDGMDSFQVDIASWRSNVGYVSQDIFLLNETIAENIRFRDPSIADEEITSAAKLAHIDEFIRSTPGGYDTPVGERGLLLSAGQRQRIVIARVLVRKPRFLILDEATSALDNESEAAIQNMLSELRGKLTVLIIAHRLSTLSAADRLLALEGGRIVEDGAPEELLKRKGSYFARVYQLAA